jgi:hypothetical protein
MATIVRVSELQAALVDHERDERDANEAAPRRVGNGLRLTTRTLRLARLARERKALEAALEHFA